MADAPQEIITKEDFEWMTELVEQAKICQQEANTLQQFTVNKLSRKYKLGPADSVDAKTGYITRNKPELKVETNEKIPAVEDNKKS